MNWIDILVLILIAIPSFFGYRKGFVRKLFGILGILAGFFLAVRFYESFSDIVAKILKAEPAVNKVTAFLLILAAVYFLFIWAATFMSSMNSGTKMADKIAGAVTGFVQGLIVSSVLLVNLSYMNYPEQSVRTSSMLYSSVYKIAPAIFDRIIVITPGIKSTYDEYKQQILKYEQQKPADKNNEMHPTDKK